MTADLRQRIAESQQQRAAARAALGPAGEQIAAIAFDLATASRTVAPDEVYAAIAAHRAASMRDSATMLRHYCPNHGGVRTGDAFMTCQCAAASALEADADQINQRPGCPDPIECDHEAELEQLRAELADRVNLREARMTLQAFRHAINGTANQITDLVRDIGRANGPVARARRESAHYRRRWESTLVEARRQAARADAAEVELDRTRASTGRRRAVLRSTVDENDRLRAELDRTRAELADAKAAGMRDAAAMLRRYCPDHGPDDVETAFMDCHCAGADEIQRDATALTAAVSAPTTT